MKKLLVLLVALFFAPSAVFAQSAYQVVGNLSRLTKSVGRLPKGKYAGVVRRTSYVPVNDFVYGRFVANARNPLSMSVRQMDRMVQAKNGMYVNIPTIVIETEFAVPVFHNPYELYGSYRMLRMMTSLAKQPGAIAKGYHQAWQKIKASQGYNGVHHIVNKSTLADIHGMMKKEARQQGKPFTVSLKDMQGDAPGSLHPFHGNPAFTDFFHNKARQLELYERGGVELIITDYFYQLNLMNKQFPQVAPKVPRSVRTGTLREARQWVHTYGLRWR